MAVATGDGHLLRDGESLPMSAAWAARSGDRPAYLRLRRVRNHPFQTGRRSRRSSEEYVASRKRREGAEAALVGHNGVRTRGGPRASRGGHRALEL